MALTMIICEIKKKRKINDFHWNLEFMDTIIAVFVLHWQ